MDVDIQPVRTYPHGATAVHLLGYVRRDDSSAEGEEAFFNHRLPDFRGIVGVEALFDQKLRGEAGAKSVLVNNLGYRQSETILTPAEPGQNVVLTIDLGVQKAAESALRIYGENTRGAVVVMDPHNGDILALASSPVFDPNIFVRGITHDQWERLNDERLRPQINRALQENYAPGSIFKTVVALAALEQGIHPNEIHQVQADPSRAGRGCIYVGRRKIEDTAPPGAYDFRRAFKLSSNSYFINAGLRVGISNIIRMGAKLHLGERTGLLTRGQETPGIFPSERRIRSGWVDGDTANACIGQGEINVTPVQMAVMTSAIANGGKVLWPRLAARLESQLPGDMVATNLPAARLRDYLGVKPRTLEVIRAAMLADVEDSDGTGRAAQVPGFRVCGKTGTAQVMNERNQVIDHTTWFISFAPYESPRYVVVVMVESGGSGGGTCAPIAKEIYQALQRRDQPPNGKTTLALN
jgi:penicillin-binding protein 2